MKLLKKLSIAIFAVMLAVTFYACSDGKILKGDGNITATETNLSDGVYKVVVEDISFTSSNDTTRKIIIKENLDNKVCSLKTDNNIADTINVSVDDNAKKITVRGDKSKQYEFGHGLKGVKMGTKN